MSAKQPENELTVGVLLKGSLADAMIKERSRTLAAYSAITRAALVEYFSKRGYDVEDDLMWGGQRDRSEADESESSGEVLAETIS